MPVPSDPLLDYLPDGVLVVDAAGVIRTVNAAAERLLGHSAARLQDRPLSEACAGTPDLMQLATDAISSGTRRARPDLAAGPGRTLAGIATPLPEGGCLLCLRDRALAGELADDAQRSDRLASLQAVASGIAHEIKNPLGGMRGAAQLLARQLDEGDERREYVDVLLREIDRVRHIVDTLRDLAHPPPPATPVSVDMNRLLNEIVLLQRAEAADNEIEVRFDPSLPAVAGDPNALTQAFLNLVRNAVEAVAGGGRVRIATGVETGRTVRDADGTRRPLIRVEIADTGAGIPAEVLQQIFTPFYTTKAKGSGLGLATTQRIIASHRGHITVESESGKGACFVVTLPATREPETRTDG